MVERGTENPGVSGSIPLLGTIFLKGGMRYGKSSEGRRKEGRV